MGSGLRITCFAWVPSWIFHLKLCTLLRQELNEGDQLHKFFLFSLYNVWQNILWCDTSEIKIILGIWFEMPNWCTNYAHGFSGVKESCMLGSIQNVVLQSRDMASQGAQHAPSAIQIWGGEMCIDSVIFYHILALYSQLSNCVHHPIRVSLIRVVALC